MATIGNDSNGRRRILFYSPEDGSRKTIRLGKVSMKDAQAVRVKVEALVSAGLTGVAPSDEVSRWLAGIPALLYDRLVRVGLVSARGRTACPTVEAFIDAYIASRLDLKPSTILGLKQSRDRLVRFLGDRRMDEVTTADMDEWHSAMIADKLARATIAKRCRWARHFFEVARRRKLIAENPLSHIKDQVTGDPKRRVYVPVEVIQRVLDGVPDPQWRLLIALARWGGLRIPSEAAALTWQDVDFENRRFIVRSAKTERHDDGGVRVVPMFPELEPLFQAVFDAAPEGMEQVLPIVHGGGANLRTQFRRYIERAGEKPWPKLWVNLRASRATDLRDEYPSHVCAAWLGHTEAVADAHYRMTTDAHFQKAISQPSDASAARNPARQPAEMRGSDRKSHHRHRSAGTAFPNFSDARKSLQYKGMASIGLEPICP